MFSQPSFILAGISFKCLLPNTKIIDFFDISNFFSNILNKFANILQLVSTSY